MDEEFLIKRLLNTQTPYEQQNNIKIAEVYLERELVPNSLKIYCRLTELGQKTFVIFFNANQSSNSWFAWMPTEAQGDKFNELFEIYCDYLIYNKELNYKLRKGEVV